MVEMVVHTLVRDVRDAANSIVVVLKEREGKRALPIVIGPHEAHAIFCELRHIEPRRPLTHDLMCTMLDELEVQLARVVVHDLRDNIYYALLVLINNGKEQTIDSRPSDAIALALRVGAPIYVADKVMEEATVSLQEEPDGAPSEADERFRAIVGDLDLDDIS
jgi:bifunctional DNase/RNase